MMQSRKQLKMLGQMAARQQQVILELNGLVRDIERCEKTIIDLKKELDAVNLKHKGRTTTREDIDYLTDLLSCAKKKLTWEKHMASLQKRAPLILESVSTLVNNTQAPPEEQARAQILQSLAAVQGAMERLQNVKVD